jgi:hypothetical protein
LILLIERLPESGSRGPACDGAEGALGPKVGAALEPLDPLEPLDEPPEEELAGTPEEPPDEPEFLTNTEFGP